MRSLFIFHRDFHIDDNLGLMECLSKSDMVYLIFIFTPQQIKNNAYFSQRSFNFMIGSLGELAQKVHISFFYEPSIQCIQRLIKELDITDLWENRDFSPFARQRQEQHSIICERMGTVYHLTNTITMLPMGTFLSPSKKPYIKFTPFYERAYNITVPKPQKLKAALLSKVNNAKLKNTIQLNSFKISQDIDVVVKAGRKEALKLINKAKKNITRYAELRDYPTKYNTTHLSAHLHFGTISPREVYWELKNTEFRKQLYWREFYMYIANYITKDNTKQSFTLSKMNKIKWVEDNAALKKWQQGKTGVPIVDAGMRELLSTGYMHNRLRMITAMYLIFYLRIHWKEGEEWFAKNLVDYSFANNYGGWVWCAGTEIYANPYFRVFSMEQQNKRFDKDCEYIKKWMPELRDLTSHEIYALYDGLAEIRKCRINEIKTFIK